MTQFSTYGWEDYVSWVSDKKTLVRINRLIQDIGRSPFEGLGKPEPLRGNLSGYWSRRINEADRLVYKVSGDDGSVITIIQARSHY